MMFLDISPSLSVKGKLNIYYRICFIQIFDADKTYNLRSSKINGANSYSRSKHPRTSSTDARMKETGVDQGTNLAFLFILIFKLLFSIIWWHSLVGTGVSRPPPQVASRHHCSLLQSYKGCLSWIFTSPSCCHWVSPTLISWIHSCPTCTRTHFSVSTYEHVNFC